MPGKQHPIVNSMLVFMLNRRATCETEAPGFSDSATILCFSAAL